MNGLMKEHCSAALSHPVRTFSSMTESAERSAQARRRP